VHRALPSFPTRRSSDLHGKLVRRRLHDSRFLAFRRGIARAFAAVSHIRLVHHIRPVFAAGLTPAMKTCLTPTYYGCFASAQGSRSEEHTSELQSRENLV